MATTSGPASHSSRAGDYPLSSGQLDELFASTGPPRPPYAEVLDALAQHDLAVLRERVLSDSAALGLTFGAGMPVAVDPVPRLIDTAEWTVLEAGLLQRSRALN